MTTYRFRNRPSQVESYWPSTTVSSYITTEIDITNNEILANVQPAMAALGYEYVSTNPTTQPSITRKTLNGTMEEQALFLFNFGAASIGQTNITRYLYPLYPGSEMALTTPFVATVGKYYTARNLRVSRGNTAGFNASIVTFTLQKNGVDTALLVTFAANDGLTFHSDTSNVVNFAPGDTASLKVTKSADIGTAMTDIIGAVDLS